MKITDQEKLEVQNLIKIIKRAKFDNFQGLEALALSRAYHWLESLLKEAQTIIDISNTSQPPKVVTVGPMTLDSKDPFNVFDKELTKQELKKKGRPKKNG